MPYAIRWAAAALFAGALLLTACQPIQPEGGTVPAPTEAPATGDPAAVVQAFWDAAGAGDFDAALNLVTDDAIIQQAPGLYVGKDEVRSFLETLQRDGVTMRMGEPQVQGDVVTSVDTVDLGGFSFPVTETVTVRDGVITFATVPGGDDAPDLIAADEPPAELTLDASAAAALQPGQHAFATTVEYTDAQGQAQTDTIRYLLYLPPEFGQDPAQQWPLILFMHGFGEHGSYLEVLKRHPLPEMLDGQQDLPAIVVSPQLPVYPIYWDRWQDYSGQVFALLDQLQAALPVDPQRVYATGLSYGGMGTWELGTLQPERWAALAPVAGFYISETGVPENICDIAQLPVWAHHSADDMDVAEADEAKIVAALKECGSDVQYTVYPTGGHEGAWRTTYADPAFWEWLFAQSK